MDAGGPASVSSQDAMAIGNAAAESIVRTRRTIEGRVPGDMPLGYAVWSHYCQLCKLSHSTEEDLSATRTSWIRAMPRTELAYEDRQAPC